MIYKMRVERDGATCDWYTIADSAIEAIVKTVLLGLTIVSWELS